MVITPATLPYYLQKKLAAFNIQNLSDLQHYSYLQVFQWLKYTHPSISYQALYDLYALYNNRNLQRITQEEQAAILIKYKEALPSYPPLAKDIIDKFLGLTLKLAITARDAGEIPIGAIIVKDDQIIGEGYNSTLKHNNILSHAEIVALNQAQDRLGNHRLDDCDLYVTIEPCVMCIGAIINSRIRRVIFGAVEPKTGAVTSQYTILSNKDVNHHTEGIGPIDNEYYPRLIKEFLQEKRVGSTVSA